MFKVGDKVTWTSQAAGISKTKIGEIFAVVPAGKHPNTCVNYKGRQSPGRETLMSRSEESYIVLASDRPGRRKLYWPRTCQLKPVDAEPKEKACICIEVRGGVVQAVHGNIPVKIRLLDWDNLKAEVGTEESRNAEAAELKKGLKQIW